MPLPGGAADKFGNRYELWWTVSQLVRILHGQADSIRIEDPGVVKAEFTIAVGGTRELHQAKRSNPDGKWSLSSLAAADLKLLQTMFLSLTGNSDRFVFISSSDAPELRELSERARQAETVQEFELQFLAAKVQKENYEKLTNYWNNTSAESAYDVLRRIEVRTIDETSLDDQVRWGLCALFLNDPDAICAELRRIAEDAVHKTLARHTLVQSLETRGYKLRRLAKIEAAAPLINEVTTKYLEGARSKFIRKSLIPRSATQKLLSRITSETSGGDSVITGKAGAGKTACVAELVENIRDRGIPVLAFRLDRFEPVSTTIELGKQLGLEESPALVLAAAATSGEAVLIVDQLDTISTVSGRSASLFDAVEGLLSEVRGLRRRLKLHVMISCRTFDWENDHRLRRMISEQHAKVEVTEFTPEEVKAVLSEERYRIEIFQLSQLGLLRLPQNLSLFLEAGFDPAIAPHFNTAKELFDRYWDTKRRAVADRTAPQAEQWTPILEKLCDEMTHAQQLFTPREKLDQFQADYVTQMASEGVLTYDGQYYGFGHESFFDYCFARSFVAKDQPLTEFLTSSEQHLFRRAQVRQVLAYLRDADRSRYCSELRKLLTDNRVRIHIKDLAIAALVTVPDPDDKEWTVIEPWLNMELAAIADGQTNHDKFASLVWQHFFTSISWFGLADRRGLVAGWLASDNNGLVNMAINILRFHQRQSGDRVAELLEPYADRGGDWVQRLRFVMEWSDHEKSRRFFDLFLRLVDNGALDEARGPIAVNSTFWSLLYGMAKTRPEWVPEVIAHWLRRRFVLIRLATADGEKPAWHNLFTRENFAAEPFHDAAASAPEIFIQHVLPVVLEITDAAIYDVENSPPKRDAVWPIVSINQHETTGVACMNALAIALENVAKSEQEKLLAVVAELRRHDTYISNYFLLKIYAAGAKNFASETAALFCDQPWRFYCGYSDSTYWVAMEVVRAIVPHCSPAIRTKLETAILHYSSDYERSPEGYKLVGRGAFVLMSAFPDEMRSAKAQARYEELKRKFGEPDAAPRGINIYTVGSPIKQEAAKKMNDEQWLRAIAKYNSNDRLGHWDDPEKGGARELAGMLQEFVKSEPERFARLSLQFPSGTNPTYIARAIDGLKDTGAPTELKLAVCRKAYAESRIECGQAIADLLGSIQDRLPDDIVHMIEWLATEHSDPAKELWNVTATSGQTYYGGDILTHGINTTRGRAAMAIGNLVLSDGSYIARFRMALDRLVNDKSISVRSCAASTLLAVANHDWQLALLLFQILVQPQNKRLRNMVGIRYRIERNEYPLRVFLRWVDIYIATRLINDDQLFATQYVDRFLYHGIHDHFSNLRYHIERMLRSKDNEASTAGARLACLAVLNNNNAYNLVWEAMAGSPSQRMGVAQVASSNIAVVECREWCERQLLKLFNDDDHKVCTEAATCFRHLYGEPLEKYENIINAFCDSAAYQEDSFGILHAIEASLHRLPGITLVVCEKYLERFSREAKDIRSRRALDVHNIAKILFRTYQQHQRDEWASRCLDLIDRMCLEGIHDVKQGLADFER